MFKKLKPFETNKKAFNKNIKKAFNKKIKFEFLKIQIKKLSKEICF